MNRKIAAGVAVALIAAAGVWGLRKLKFSGNLDAVRPLPDFEMTAVTVRTLGSLRKKDLEGAPWIANFIFTRCGGPCPVLSSEMAGLQRTLPEGIRLVSFTVDPDWDTPKVLAKYAQSFGAEPGRWLFVTGEKGALYKLMYEGFNLPILEDRRAPSGFRVTHSTKFVLVDGRGIVRGYYGRDGANSMEHLKRDALRLLKGES